VQGRARAGQGKGHTPPMLVPPTRSYCAGPVTCTTSIPPMHAVSQARQAHKAGTRSMGDTHLDEADTRPDVDQHVRVDVLPKPLR
jgi:hypothetical protein